MLTKIESLSHEQYVDSLLARIRSIDVVEYDPKVGLLVPVLPAPLPVFSVKEISKFTHYRRYLVSKVKTFINNLFNKE